jgi:hypothetical protein
MGYYFSIYIVQLAATAIPVVLNYFERQIGRDQFESTRASILTTGGFPSMGVQMATDESLLEAMHAPLLQADEGDLKKPKWASQADPEGSANIFSRLVFSWISPLMSYGYRHEIEEVDLWPLQRKFNTIDVAATFRKTWEAEKKSAPRTNRKPSLISALFAAFGVYFWSAAPLLAIQNVAQLSLPFLLGPLIDFVGSDQPIYIGYLYSMGFFVGLMIMVCG